MMGGIVPLARVRDDLVQDGAREVLIPDHGAFLRHDVDAGGLSLGCDGDDAVAIGGAAVDLPLLTPVVDVLDLRLGLADLELGERLLRGRGRAVHRGGHDRFGAALREVDAPAGACSGGRHDAPRRQGPPPPSRSPPRPPTPVSSPVPNPTPSTPPSPDL